MHQPRQRTAVAARVKIAAEGAAQPSTALAAGLRDREIQQLGLIHRMDLMLNAAVSAPPAELTPQAFLQLAGHPLRWRLLGELARSDRTVHELTGLVGEPQNLVSYHLGKLRDARLVSARRSSADGRDAYYTRRPDPRRRAAVGHRRGPPPRPSPHPAPPSRRRTGDAGDRTGAVPVHRQQRPVADGRGAGPGALRRAGRGVSAGSHPKPLHPNAVRVMRDEHGIDLAGHALEAPERVRRAAVRLGDQPVRPGPRGVPRVPRRPRDHPLEHPRPGRRPRRGDDEASYPAFQQTAAELETRVGFLLAALTDPTPCPDERTGGTMTEPDEMVSVRYMVDDVDDADRLLHQAPRLRGARQLRARLRRRRPAATCGCCSAGRPARPAGRCPTAPSRAPAAGTASTSSSTTSPPRSPGSATPACPFRNDIVTGPGG